VEQRWDINRLGDEVNKLTVGDTPKCALS